MPQLVLVGQPDGCSEDSDNKAGKSGECPVMIVNETDGRCHNFRNEYNGRAHNEQGNTPPTQPRPLDADGPGQLSVRGYPSEPPRCVFHECWVLSREVSSKESAVGILASPRRFLLASYL
jgi:hypothetical protein